MSTNQYTLDNALFSDLLSPSTRNIRYKIPYYQRGYVWGEEQWEDLYKDVCKSNSEIFMGVIISIDKNVGQPPVVVRDVIDGQQRITTLFILLLALWKKMGELAVKQLLSDSGVSMNTAPIIDIKRMLYTSDDVRGQLRLEPAKVNSNQSDLYKLISELDDYSYAVNNQVKFSRERTLVKLIAPTDGSPLNKEKRAIWKCFVYFYNQLPDDSGELELIYNQCKKLQFVLITCREENEGYYLFQVLNDRGVDLSEMDIIKSYIFGNLGNLNGSDLDKYHNEWVILENSLNTKTVRERFFRHLYNSSLRFKYEKSGGNRPETNRRELVRNYSELITDIQSTDTKNKEKNIQNFYEVIVFACTEYAFFSNPKDINTSSFPDTSVVSKLDVTTINRLENLSDIEASTANMLLLKIHLWIHEKKLDMDNKKYVELLDFLCAFYIRRNIMGLPSTNKMDPFVVTLVDKLTEKYKGDFLSKSNKIEWNDLIETIKSHYMDQQQLQSVTWADFKKTLQEVDMYKQHKKILNVLFSRIEEDYSSLITSPFHSDSTNIDHIYPQNPSNGEKWSNYVGLLGNLTPVYVKVNSAFSNAAFDKKRDYKDKGGNSVGYAHGRFKLDNLLFDFDGQQTSLATIDKWTKDSITNRTNAIIKYLHENHIISLPGEE